MAKLKFRPARPGGFSGSKAYIVSVEVLKKRRNAVGRTFCDAIKVNACLHRLSGLIDRSERLMFEARVWLV